jgi:hypothetical protein
MKILRRAPDGHVELVELTAEECMPKIRRKLYQQIVQLARHHGLRVGYRRHELGVLVRRMGTIPPPKRRPRPKLPRRMTALERAQRKKRRA